MTAKSKPGEKPVRTECYVMLTKIGVGNWSTWGRYFVTTGWFLSEKAEFYVKNWVLFLLY